VLTLMIGALTFLFLRIQTRDQRLGGL